MGRIASVILAAGWLGFVVAAPGLATESASAFPDSSVSPPRVAVDTTGATAVEHAPSRAVAPRPAIRRTPLTFVELRFGWFRPEDPEGDLTVRDLEYWTLGWSVGGRPAVWLDLMAEVDVHGVHLDGPPPPARPGVTLTGSRGVVSVFAGLTGRIVHVCGPARSHVSLSLGVVRSTMEATGTEAYEVFPLFGLDPSYFIQIPYSTRERDTAGQAIVGAGVRFLSRHNPEIGLDLRYSTLRQSFGDLGTARVGGLSVEITLQFDPLWRPKQRPSAKSS